MASMITVERALEKLDEKAQLMLLLGTPCAALLKRQSSVLILIREEVETPRDEQLNQCTAYLVL